MAASSTVNDDASFHFDSSPDIDRLASFLEPLAILPCQFFGEATKGLRGPERNLMAALLTEGIEAYIAECTSSALEKVLSSKNGEGKNVLEDADPCQPQQSEICEWVESSDDSYVFSFEVICSCLGIHPEYLRKGLKHFIQRLIIQRRQNSPTRRWKKIRRPRMR